MRLARDENHATDLQGALPFLFSDSLDSMGMCRCRVPKMPPLLPLPPAEPPGSTVPLGSVGSGGSSVTANLTATAVVGVIVELISCSHGVDIRQPVATRGHTHLPRSRLYAVARRRGRRALRTTHANAQHVIVTVIRARHHHHQHQQQ